MKFIKNLIALIKYKYSDREKEPTEIYDFRIQYKHSPYEIYMSFRCMGLCHFDAYTAVQVLWDFINVYPRLLTEENKTPEEVIEIHGKTEKRWKGREKFFLNRA